jgi:hypothetical protein
MGELGHFQKLVIDSHCVGLWEAIAHWFIGPSHGIQKGTLKLAAHDIWIYLVSWLNSV